MNEELTFKVKFPELNENQIKQIERELLELVGPELEHSHMTRVYDEGCQDRDLVNSHKRAIRNRITQYLKNTQSISHNEKESTANN